MNILKIILIALFSITELFILTKLMGKRQISQLSFFDYICGISIGSIAAEMATEPFEKFYPSAIAMLIYAVITFLISFTSDKIIKARAFLENRPTILYDNGKIIENALSKARIDVNEFLMECRINGYFNLEDLQTVIFESNGKFSFLPKANKKPVSPYDMNLSVNQEELFLPVVIDGKALENNLKKCGKDIIWLKSQIKEKNNGKIADTLLAACDKNNNFICYKKQ